MKNIILLISIIGLIALGSNCSRHFYGQANDGNGGMVRYGAKVIFAFVNPSYAEHCTPQGGNLVCKSLKVTYK